MPVGGSSLWQRAHARATAARRGGALRPVVTRIESLRDGGIDFVVRVAQGLKAKEAAAGDDTRAADPFSEPEPELLVGELSPTHFCLLNKFNVLDDHLLVVTHRFIEQRTPLAAEDFAALQTCMQGRASLGFYNSGRAAGASQARRHLQVVPLPLAPQGGALPIEPIVRRFEQSKGIAQAAGLPFRHALVFTGMAAGAAALFDAYRGLLDALAMMPSAADGRLPPYSLVVTRAWSLLVPRSCDEIEGIPVNSLGYAGALLVRDEAGLARLRRIGPMQVLARAAQR